MNENKIEQKIYDDYPMPVGDLLIYGEPQKDPLDLSAFKNLNMDSSHIPLLIKMLTDERLDNAPKESHEIWAPLHAWRILGMLKAKEAIEPLIHLFEPLEEDDWFISEIGTIFGQIGKDALPKLEKYLQNPNNKYFPKMICADCIKGIGLVENRENCVKILKKQLRNYLNNDPTLNASLIASILELKGNIPFILIEKAYMDDAVDETFIGTYEEILAKYSTDG